MVFKQLSLCFPSRSEAIEFPEPGSLGDLFSKIETNDFIKGFCTESSDNYFDYFTKYFVFLFLFFFIARALHSLSPPHHFMRSHV